MFTDSFENISDEIRVSILTGICTSWTIKMTNINYAYTTVPETQRCMKFYLEPGCVGDFLLHHSNTTLLSILKVSHSATMC